MDKGIFESNVKILDLEVNHIMQILDTVDPASDEYEVLEKNLKQMLDCQAVPAKMLLEIEKFEEEQRQFVLRREHEEADFDAKLDFEREKAKQELELAREKLVAEQQQADKRHQHDLDELEEEKRHNLVEEAQRIKSDHERNLITGGGIILTTILAGAIYAGECKGAVIGSGATSILRLIRLF